MSYIVSFHGTYVRGYLARSSKEVTKSKSRAKRFRHYLDAKFAADSFRSYCMDQHAVYVLYKIVKG